MIMLRRCCLLFLLLPLLATAQRSDRFGPYELFYSVINTTFLSPNVASTYGITRGKNRAFINLAVREHMDDGSTEARTMQMTGRSWDLIANKQLAFQEINESGAIYYIAEFKFINEEWHFFEFDFRPKGADQSFSFKYKQQLYIN